MIRRSSRRRAAAAVALTLTVGLAIPTSGPAHAADSDTRVVIGDSITYMSRDLIDCGQVDAIPGRASDGNLFQPVGGEFGAVDAVAGNGSTDAHWVFAIGSTELHTIDTVADARVRIDSMVDAVNGRGDISFVMVEHRGFPRETLAWNAALYLTEGIDVIRWTPDPALLDDDVHPNATGRERFARAVCGLGEV